MTLFSKRIAGLGLSMVAAALIAPATPARAQGVVGRVGDAIDSAGRGIRNGVQNAFSKTQAAVHAQELIDRVYSRLHWDKTLTGSALDLEVQAGGIAILRGAVPDEATRQRALILTRDTVGVLQVVDELTILSPSGIVPASPTASTRSTTTIGPASSATVITPTTRTTVTPNGTTTTTVVKP